MKTNFKILLVILFFLGIYNISFAQSLTGVKTVTHLGGGDYLSIAAAIADLNSKGVGTGGVIFDVAPGHIETFASPTSGTITATGTALNPIVFRKASAGTNPLITASGLGTLPATGSTTPPSHADGIIIIVGGDFITFDGIDVQENSSATTNTLRSEYGYYLKRASTTDGCKYVTIKNCSITLNKANTGTSGIFVSDNYMATSGITLTSTGGRSEYVKIYSNSISNCYHGIIAYGYGTATPPYDLYDQNMEIGVDGANNITNFGGGSSTVYGIQTNYQNNLKVANNIVNGGSGTTASQIYGIRTDNGTNSSLDLYSNQVTIQSGSATGAPIGIYNSMGSSGTSNTVNIYNNIVENISFSPAATSGTITGISQAASPFILNFYNNIVRNNTKAGTGTFTGITNTSLGTNGTLNFYNNSVYGNSNTGTGTLTCVNIAPSATATSNIYGNNIYNNSTAGSTVTGLGITNGTTNYVYKNNIYNLSAGAATTSVYGITAGGGINFYLYNNYISDIKTPASNSSPAINGVNVSGGTNFYAYYNTVYLNASSSAAGFSTNAIYISTSVAADMKNNIFVNVSTPGSTGKTVAYKRSASGFTNYTGNNNCFYAGTPGTKNLIFSDAADKQTMSDYFAYVTPRDGSSFSELPPFVNTAAAPYDLHLQTTVNTQCESGGSVISTPNITQDFDLDARYPNSGYPNKVGYPASAPDVGADEFGGQKSDLSPPSISYTPITNKPAGTSLVLNNFAVITDPSGVNTTSGTSPRLYYKKSGDKNEFNGNTNTDDGWKWVETTSGSSPYSFTIDYTIINGGSISGGDIINYFVVAQDNSPSPKVGINAGSFSGGTPSSVELANPISILTANSYTITSGLSGTITVGTSGTYPSLTGAGGLFAAINLGVVSGNITVNIVSDITETGANALNQFTEYPDGSNYTITIQPDAAINRTLSGSTAASSGLIKLNGADRVTFDGRYGGSGNYLTIQNLSTNTNTAAIHLASLGTGLGANNNTIRNCNIKAGSNTVTSTIGIFVGSATVSTFGTGANNNNLTIQDNNISKCFYGIIALGVTVTGELNNLNISNNIIGSSTASEYVTGYGMSIASANGPIISGNEIFNMIWDGNKYGINFGTTVYNASVSKNKIHGLGGALSANKACVGIYFSSGTLTSNNTIDNNIIYDLTSFSSAGSNYGPYGIWFAGGTTFNIYYNSVYLSGALGGSTSGSYSSCVWISSQTTNINIKNNAFHNAITGISPRTYLIGSVPSNTSFADINYNDYYTTGGYFGQLGSAYLTFADWKTAIGQDANSKNVNPDFQSTTDLRPGTVSGLLNSATPIGGFSTDILGVSRNVTTPTMGAYEQGVDASGPSISYSLLAGTSSTSNRTISNVTITDPVGVSSSPKPRLYFKRSTDANTYNDNTNGTDGWKYAESNGTSSPFDFTFNYSLLNGGTGVTTGTIVQYFITAQDLNPSPGVSINSGIFAIAPSSVALTSAAFPIGGTINSFKVNTALSGIVTVGTGGTYPTLTGAGGLFEALNSTSVGGNITVNIKSDLTEPGTNPLNEFFTDGAKTNYTVTIQPEDAVMKTISITTASNTGLINLNGCKGVTIDGSFSGSGKYLTFRNTEYLNFTNSSVIALRNGASNNTIQNCILEGAVGVNTCGVVFFDYGANTGNKITNCDLKNVSSLPAAAKPYNGIYSGSLLNKDNIISSCNIYDFSTNGIYIDAAGGYYIDSCNIYLTSPSGGNVTGIQVNNPGNTKIVKNNIHDLDSQTGSNGRSRGIYYNPGSNPMPSNISIENNSISFVLTATNNFVLGFDINSTVSNSNFLSIYNNSVYIGGSITNTTTSYSAGLNILNAVMSGLIHKNNAYHNDRIISGGNGKNYAFVANTSSSLTALVSDYNDYYVSGTPGALCYWYGSDLSTMSDLRANSLNDYHSYNGNPGFTSASNLMPDVTSPNAWNVYKKGIPISTISTDINNNTRSTTLAGGSTCIGAYEFAINSVTNPPPAASPSAAPAAGTTTSYAYSGMNLASITWGAGGTVPSNIELLYYSGTNPPNSTGFQVGNCYWKINPTGGTGFTYDITFNYDEAMLGTITSEDKIRLVKSEDGVTYIAYLTQGTGPGQYQLNTTNNTITVYGLTSFSYFGLNDADTPLPVELASFTAVINSRDVNLNWKTGFENNNKGFEIERKRVNTESWSKLGFVNGKNTATGSEYKFEDKKLESGKYNYRLKQIDFNGNYEYFNLANAIEVGIPTKYNMSQNYPNPFNPTTKIDFDLPLDSRVSIIMYDMTGREVKTLVNEQRTAGYHTVQFNASGLSSGTYFYRIMTKSSAADFIMTKKMMLVK